MVVEEVCHVCKIPSILKCAKCNVTVYCSRDHQKQDWKTHKKECWPLVEALHDTYGKYWIASRDIPAGAIILKECPAISGPHIPSIAKTPVGLQLELYTEKQQAEAKWDHACLGCNTLLTEEAKKLCSKCGWPVCGHECEQMPIHSQNECPFFVEQEIKYPIQDLTPHTVSFAICIVRGMFLQRKDPVLCSKLINNLEDAVSSASRGPNNYSVEQITQYVQIRAAFKARYFQQADDDEDVWPKLVKILRRNGVKDICKVDGREKQEASVFPMANLFLRECVPNADQVKRRLNSAANLTGSNLQIQIRALCRISKGDPIRISFGPTSLDYGTEERIDFRLKLCQSLCICRRCWDPTELGTYSSAIKCKTCSAGYMLPENFFGLSEPYICPNCPGKKIRRRKVKKLIYELFQEEMAMEKFLIDNDRVDAEEDGMKVLEQFINNHSGSVLHPNHWILQRAMVRFCFTLEPAFAENPANIERALIYGRQLIGLTELITPGLVFEKIELMLRTASYGSLDLKNKANSLAEEEVKTRHVEIHGWASAVLKYWEQEMAEEPSAVTIEKKPIEDITEDMALARSLIQESEEMVLIKGSFVEVDEEDGKFQQMSISGDSKA